MAETASPHRIGKFGFSVEIEETKCEPEQRAAALANWLLAEWDRQNEPLKNGGDGCSTCRDGNLSA